MTTFEQALWAQSAPGTNLKGSVDGANWCFLLPRLELGRVLTLGRPAASSLATLSKLGDEVLVWANAVDHDRVRVEIEERNLGNVRMLARKHGKALPLPDEVIDVVLVANPRLAPSGVDGANVRGELVRVLKPTGALYVESRPLDWRHRRSSEWSLAPAQHTFLWAAPAWGELRFAAPVGDPAAASYLERRFLKPLVRRTLLKRPGRVAARTPLANRLVRRCPLIVTRDGETELRGPPAYVRTIAEQAGTTVEGLRWAFAAPGEHSSQKAIFFLFDDAGVQPRSVVKITRDESHNRRLENEWRALGLLQERGIGDERTRPSPLFLGHHAGLAVLGETAITGTPFLEQTEASHECPHARRVTEWLLDLGISTAHTPADPSLVISRLRAVLERFDELYRPDDETSLLLSDQMAALAGGTDALRLVFQHGDPGPWNIVVTPDGRPGFLDWEAADPDGMPLWDLFHFVRSFGLAVSQKAGRRDPGSSFADQILAASGVNGLLVETTNRFCTETGVSNRLVEPLFYLCWVHRAVKEASRLSQGELESGRYFNLLRLAVARRDAPGLHRLFSPASGA